MSNTFNTRKRQKKLNRKELDEPKQDMSGHSKFVDIPIQSCTVVKVSAYSFSDNSQIRPVEDMCVLLTRQILFMYAFSGLYKISAQVLAKLRLLHLQMS